MIRRLIPSVTRTQDRRGSLNARVMILLPLLIGLIGGGGMWWLRATPQKAATAYLEATKQGDSKALHALYSAETRRLMPFLLDDRAATGRAASDRRGFPNLDYKIQSTEVSGSRATVKAALHIAPGRSGISHMEFVREKGVWKLDLSTRLRQVLRRDGISLEQYRQKLQGQQQSRLPLVIAE